MQQLQFYQSIQEEFQESSIGGLLLISRSLGLYQVIADFLDSLTQNAYNLGFLLNFSDYELELIISLRKKQEELPVQKLGYEVISKKRAEKYLKGGIFAVSLTTLTFDMLNKKILPLEIVKNIVINRVEEIEHFKDQESWLCTLYKMANPGGHVLGVSENVENFKQQDQVINTARYLYVNKIFLWPNYRKEVIFSFQATKDQTFEVQEHKIKLTKNQEKIQENLVKICKEIMEIIESKYKKMKNVFFDEYLIFQGSKEMIIDKVINNKDLLRNINQDELYRDLLDFRQLMTDLIMFSCVEFHRKLLKIQANSEENSIWQIGINNSETNKQLQNLIKYSKRRLYEIKQIEKNVNNNTQQQQQFKSSDPIKIEETQNNNNKDLQTPVQSQQYQQNEGEIKSVVKLKVTPFNENFYQLSQQVKIEGGSQNIIMEQDEDNMEEEKEEEKQQQDNSNNNNNSQMDIQSPHFQQPDNQNQKQLFKQSMCKSEPQINPNEKEINFELDYELKLKLELSPKLKVLKDIIQNLEIQNKSNSQNSQEQQQEDQKRVKKCWIYTQHKQKVFEIQRFLQNVFVKNDKDNRLYMHEQLKYLVMNANNKAQREKQINQILGSKLKDFNEKESEQFLLQELSFELEMLFEQYTEFHIGTITDGNQINQSQSQSQNQNSKVNSFQVKEDEQEEEENDNDDDDDDQDSQIQNHSAALHQNVQPELTAFFQSLKGGNKTISNNQNKTQNQNQSNDNNTQPNKKKEKQKQKDKENDKQNEQNKVLKRRKFKISDKLKRFFKHIKLDNINAEVVDELDENGRVVFMNEGIIENFEFRINSYKSSAQRQFFIQEYQPDYVILFEPFLDIQRELNSGQFQIENKIQKVFVLMQLNTLESSIYREQVKLEQNYFESAIKQSMKIPNIVEDPYHRVKQDQRKEVSTRFHEGYEIIPMMLKKGDIIISDDIAIERKAIETGDFVESVKSGRLEDQLKRMQESFKTIILLLEWGEHMTFDLDSIFEYRIRQQKQIKDLNDQQQYLEQKYKFICTQIPILCKKYPKVKILWSKGPSHTVKLIKKLKEQCNKEPSIEQMQKLAIQDSDKDSTQAKLEKYLLKGGIQTEKEAKKKSAINLLENNNNDDEENEIQQQESGGRKNKNNYDGKINNFDYQN